MRHIQVIRIMNQSRRLRSNRAFTIVELLVVIVVIGILAVVTAVAYRGVQQRAQEATISGTLNQAAKKVKLYHVDNSEYPNTLTEAGVTDSAVSFQYTATTDDYCITGSQGSSDLFVSDTQPVPQDGTCTGHTEGGARLILDSFDRADSAALGQTDTGEDWSWSGTQWQIYSNTIRGNGSTDSTVDWGEADMKVSATFVTSSNYQTLAIRYNPPYTRSSAYRLTSSGASSTLARRVNGSNTTIYTVGSITAGTRFTLSANEEPGGTRVILIRDGVEVFNFLDTAATRPMGTRAGFVQATSTYVQFDDLRIESP